MFLVRDTSLLNTCVFTHIDPRHDRYTGPLEEDITLEIDDSTWREGERRPIQALGVSLTNPKSYRVFKHEDEVTPAGFKLVLDRGPFVIFSNWQDYVQWREQVRANV